jgi:tetratricopeptide (TPR) repeat protein
VNTRILELDPGNLAALTRRGRCYQEQGNFPAAKEDYFRALQIYPESALVKEALGRIEREEKRAPAKMVRARARPRVGGIARHTKRAQERAAARTRKEAEEFRRVEGLKSLEEAYNPDRAEWINSVLKRLLADRCRRKR